VVCQSRPSLPTLLNMTTSTSASGRWLPERPPSDTGAPPWGPLRRKVRVGLIVAAVAILATGAGMTGYVLSEPSTTSQAAATPRTSPVPRAALDGLLLSPDQISTAVGATGMTVAEYKTTMYDDSTNVADPACRSLAGSLMAQAYAGSGWSALREQILRDAGDTWPHHVDQGVVLFPSARAASGFFTASAQQWPACSNRLVTYSEAGQPDNVYNVGPVSNINGTLTYSTTQPAINTGVWACQRALTAADDVVIDIYACSWNPAGDAATDIAHQIAAKVVKM
jgi:serine/threonine kinase PknH